MTLFTKTAFLLPSVKNSRLLWEKQVVETVLEVKGITKQYPGSKKKANNNISFDLRKGEILCIAGENGAGKTTLMKILIGLQMPDAGEIFINGKKEIINSPAYAKKLRIGMVHQHFMLFPEYTVAENIVMGMEPKKFNIFFDVKKAKETAEKTIKDHDFKLNAGQKIKDLSPGQMQQAEICRILHRDAQIIILDEPTSILTEQEADALFKTLEKFAAGGKSIILITHKLREIKGKCARVAVLRSGEMAGIRDARETDEYEIARMMTGEDIPQFEASAKTPVLKTEPVIEFDNVTVKRKMQKLPLLDGVSFKVFPNEILGFAGVGGNGLGVIEAVLGGFLHPAQGKVLHRGKDISAFKIRALRKEGLAYVPSDRIRVGSAVNASIDENLIINRRVEFLKKKFNKNAVKDFSQNLIKSYNIEGARGVKKCSSLSGGNLQKLILAREIDFFRDYIVFSEPSWGLDFASSRFIMKEIEALKEKGAAVILISTNLDEILLLADRIIVMYKGKAAKEFENTKNESIKTEIANCMQGLGVPE
jgi:simple sugar transport system ATP-binding protein